MNGERVQLHHKMFMFLDYLPKWFVLTNQYRSPNLLIEWYSKDKVFSPLSLNLLQSLKNHLIHHLSVKILIRQSFLIRLYITIFSSSFLQLLTLSALSFLAKCKCKVFADTNMYCFSSGIVTFTMNPWSKEQLSCTSKHMNPQSPFSVLRIVFSISFV